jgi:putative ABC transport system ATP-binding protein
MGLSLLVEDLTWGFPGSPQPFLRFAGLSLAAGQFLAVSGPSGAGKSTLLHLLAGLETPDSGVVRWGDRDLGREAPARRDAWRRANVGLVFQDFQLVPGLTATENVLLPLTFSRWSLSRQDRHRAAEMLIRLGVIRTQALASTLSRGEMQRTALARALFGRPSVLLADEPTASLDSVNEEAVSGLLVEHARREGATIVVATHQPRLSQRADVRIRLDHGTVQREDA